MKYCTQCGEKIKKNAKVCMYCGAVNEVNSVDALKEQSKVIGESVQKNAEKFIKFSKDKTEDFKNSDDIQNRKNNIINHLKSFKLKKWCIGAGIIALLIIIFLMLPKFNTPEETINKFQKSIMSNDITELKKIIKSEDKELDISDDNLGVLIAYYKVNPLVLNKHIDNLKIQINNENLQTNDFMQLVKEKGFLKERYYINIIPRYIKLESKYDDIEVNLKSNDYEISVKEGSHIIGPLMPGEYELSAKLKDELSNDTQTVKINLFETGEEAEHINLLERLNRTDISCNDSNAIVFIDGKSTSKKVKDLNSILGLKDDTKVYCVVNIDDTEYKSQELKVCGNQQLNFKIDDTVYSRTLEDVKTEVTELISQYVKNFSEAVNSDNVNLILDYLYDGSNIYNEQLKNVTSIYNDGIREKYITHEVKDIKYDKKTNLGNIRVNESYEITSKDGKKQNKDFSNEYEFKYNDKDKKYQLTKVEVTKK